MKERYLEESKRDIFPFEECNERNGRCICTSLHSPKKNFVEIREVKCVFLPLREERRKQRPLLLYCQGKRPTLSSLFS
jgi:hypothetical protein